MAAEPRLGGVRVRTLAIGASASVHIVLLILLLWRLGTAPSFAVTPVMNVELMPLRRIREAAAEPRRERTDLTSATTSTAAPPMPPAVRPGDRPVTAPDSGAASVAPEATGMQQALRGLLGCQHAALVGLTAREREHCQDRLAAEAAGQLGSAAPKLNLDQRGAFGRDPEPYLNRKPKNGCKLKAGGDVSVMGQQGEAAALSCAWSF
jgi:hypothetical protein